MEPGGLVFMIMVSGIGVLENAFRYLRAIRRSRSLKKRARDSTYDGFHCHACAARRRCCVVQRALEWPALWYTVTWRAMVSPRRQMAWKGMQMIATMNELNRVRDECYDLVKQRAKISAGTSAIPALAIDVAADVAILLELVPTVNKRFGLSKEQIEPAVDPCTGFSQTDYRRPRCRATIYTSDCIQSDGKRRRSLEPCLQFS